MVIYDLDKAPQRLRGMLSRFCLEVRAGLFVGRLDARMRDLLWERITTLANASTRAVMIWREATEQGYAFRTLGKDRRMPVQVDGTWLVQWEKAEPTEEARNRRSTSKPQPGETSGAGR